MEKLDKLFDGVVKMADKAVKKSNAAGSKKPNINGEIKKLHSLNGELKAYNDVLKLITKMRKS